MSTRVLIVDDHPLFRDALARLVESAADLGIAGLAGTARMQSRLLVRAAWTSCSWISTCRRSPASRPLDSAGRIPASINHL
jgi:DNA-binding NarL/FixJ family response regulator